MEKLTLLYIDKFGERPDSIEKLPGAGSNRQYYRMYAADGSSVIGVIGTSRDENHAFLTIGQHFEKRRLPVPHIICTTDDELRYLQEDLGSRSLFDAIRGGREAGGRYNKAEKELLIRTIRELPNIQIRGARGLDFTVCYPQPEFDVDNVLFDLNYFKYCFLKATDIDFHEMKLEASFRMLAKDLVAPLASANGEDTHSLHGKAVGESFMYRDFQARNVMLDAKGKPYFIDFQGGRRGPFYYDVASFLWQASARYSDSLRKMLIHEYYDALKQYTEVPSMKAFNERLQLFVLFRTLQVLGAYGFRGYFERKKHFIDSIPPAIENLRQLLRNNNFPYPYLVDLLNRMCALPRFMPAVETPRKRDDGLRTAEHDIYKAHPQDGPATFSKYDGAGELTVKVFSFSYRKGIPEDNSGNGGGYVFDCRSTHNPGRYEPYKKLTGLDEPVIRFLEDDGEILTFLDAIYRLADHHVERYMQRGFTSLMFSFGCTGGQHRSVYSAQHLAEHINRKYGIRVEICHREQGITQTLAAIDN